MLRLVAAVALVITAMGVSPVADTRPVAHQSPSFDDPSLLEDEEFGRKTFSVHVYENGSARWTHLYRRDLPSGDEREQFLAFAEQFNNAPNNELKRQFTTNARELTQTNSNLTGRTMNATEFQYDAHLGRLNNSGVVELSFVWTNFTQQQGNEHTVSDVFDSGLFLGQDQRFELTWSENLTVKSVTPKPDERSTDTITYTGTSGGRVFYDKRPKIVFVRAGTQGQYVKGTTNDGLPWELIGGAVGFLLLAAVIAVRRTDLLQRRHTESEGEKAPPARHESESSITDADLMTDEDRVVALLKENGGRMKQVQIVEATNWSKSKVSMLLSDMDEDDKISKLRVGRENIISLAGNEPDAVRSPFEDS
ncbi:helix-turn-helix transcriptional regulator [Halocatena halophila]|uniref:helix-turn-helix transcriptional regulator n=1 Tax=Halocatena halophila TaxID=2814576 RepID=UPI002ED29D7C